MENRKNKIAKKSIWDYLSLTCLVKIDNKLPIEDTLSSMLKNFYFCVKLITSCMAFC